MLVADLHCTGSSSRVGPLWQCKLASRSLGMASSRSACSGVTARRRLAVRAQKTAEPVEKKSSSNGASTSSRRVLQSTDLDLEPVEDEGCNVFTDSEGHVMEVMCCDYGFRSGFGRLYQGQPGEIPKSFFALGKANFSKEFKQLRRSIRLDEYDKISKKNPATTPLSKASGAIGKKLVQGLSAVDRRLERAGVLSPIKDKTTVPAEAQKDNGEVEDDCNDVRTQLAKLTLNDKAVWKREESRHVPSPWYIRGSYLALCIGLDVIYANRPIQRFWFLETVARMPYFAYISMLHLYESLGWWRAGAELRKVHFAEEWNELHHLQIMESLGGDQLWIDRFLAQHAAVFYFWVLVLFFVFSPKLAYKFSELVEGHATDTYTQFCEENEELLHSLPPPLVALEYYKSGDLYMFDMFQTSTAERQARRPTCDTLYDVFRNIRDDEDEHVKTMKACGDYSIVSQLADRKDALTPKDKARAGIKTMDETKLE